MPRNPLPMRHKPWLGYGLALLAFALAFLTRWLAGSAMEGLPFVTFFLATLVTAALAGTGPALLCLFACLLAAWYFFLGPVPGFGLVWPQGPVALLAFVLVSGAQILLVHRLHQALARLEAQRGAMAEQAARHRLMYQELQHRVANGIQAVASSLAAQAGLSPEAQPALDEAAERLLGVAEVHRRLHDPELGGRMGEMLDGMLRQLMVSAGRSDVAVTVQVEAGSFSPETASLLGLVVAEAASNSIKYAFAGRFGGRLDVGLQRVSEGGHRLLIEDDGPGFRASRPVAEDSLGMTLMQGFAERLHGRIRFGEAPAGGAAITLEFPAETGGP